ncbi:serine/threonine protein kinase [Aphelenchoides avenae]|nr:serine/threonine protein kinase [Aphelenchus avenae]
MSSSGSVPKPKLELGGIIGGQWKVLSELGSGGCGIVYRVERVTDGLQAALKAETVDKKYTQTLKAEVSYRFMPAILAVTGQFGKC